VLRLQLQVVEASSAEEQLLREHLVVLVVLVPTITHPVEDYSVNLHKSQRSEVELQGVAYSGLAAQEEHLVRPTARLQAHSVLP